MNKRNLSIFTTENILVWISAFCLMEYPMRYFYLNYIGGNNLKTWYEFKEFNIYNVFSGDLFYVLGGIIISYRIYNYFFKNEDNMLKFFSIFLLVQIIGDLTFYTIISNFPKKYDNRWTRFFKNYGKTSGLYALFGDSIYIAIWALIAYYIKDISTDILLFIIFTFLFITSAIAEN